MPVIVAPAHEFDTLYTVTERIKTCNQNLLGTDTRVLTTDMAPYYKLMEMKWKKNDDTLIPRLGGLHIAMNFEKVLGQHMQSSGPLEALVESGIMGPTSAQQVMDGKHYACAIRAHKLTYSQILQMSPKDQKCRWICNSLLLHSSLQMRRNRELQEC